MGEVCWGHVTGVIEENIIPFTAKWFGTGVIENSGDTERVGLEMGQHMESEIVDTGINTITLLQNNYAAGDTGILKYRTAAAEVDVYSASWQIYSSPFESLGYVQLRLEHPGLLEVSATNARYLVDQLGNPHYLSGFHTWYSAQDGGDSDPPAALDWDEYLTAVTSRNCNFVKLWAMETARGWSDTTNQWFVPTRYTRTGPGNDNDGKLKFDLDQINQDYLDRLYSRVKACAEAGIYVCVQLFQGWQVEVNKGGTGDPCAYHPYLLANNINSADGDDDNNGDLIETHYDTAANNVLAYQQALVEAIVDLLNDFDNVIWEISNEDTGSVANTGWQTDMIDYLRTYEATKPKQHLIGMTKQWPNESDTALDNSGADWVSYSATKADAIHVASDPVSMYDTDHTVGLTSDYEWIWSSFCEGHGGAWYMDEWDGALYGSDRRNNATYILIRDNLGYVADLVDLLNDMLGMTPQPSLCTTNFCLAKDHATAAEYICFQDNTGSFNLNLTTTTGTLNIRWLRCSDGSTDTDTVSGGAVRTLTPPWSGVVVAYVYH